MLTFFPSLGPQFEKTVDFVGIVGVNELFLEVVEDILGYFKGIDSTTDKKLSIFC